MAEERSQEIMQLATEQAQMIMRRTEEQTENNSKLTPINYTTETLRNLREQPN